MNSRCRWGSELVPADVYPVVPRRRAPHKLKTMRRGTSIGEGRGAIDADADADERARQSIKEVTLVNVTDKQIIMLSLHRLNEQGFG